jgi:Short C-terminal domain
LLREQAEHSLTTQHATSVGGAHHESAHHETHSHEDEAGNLDLLAKLGALHASGVLTDEEFAAQKHKLLSGT